MRSFVGLLELKEKKENNFEIIFFLFQFTQKVGVLW